MTVADNMKQAVRRLQRGKCTIEECERDLNEIIESLKPITEYDLEGVEPTFHPIGSLSNVMREDVETTSFTQAEALSNAPAKQDSCFLIPSILGEGGDR